MEKKHFTEDIVEVISKNPMYAFAPEAIKIDLMRNLQRIKDLKVNILITGATGCGKSSTINAMFNTNKAKVGQGSTPETMDIAKYEMDNVIIYDSPGLGDGKEADIRHSKNIIGKLLEKDSDGNLLIDLVLVILEGSTRDLGTSFELINNIIIPNLGEDKQRLLVAINQADVAMKGRGWNVQKNEPEPVLVKFLEEKCLSTKNRIKEATGVDVDPIYYAAGYKDGDSAQQPYNLSKLFLFILRHTKKEKRAVFAQDMNRNEEMWKKHDEVADYEKEIKKSFTESVMDGISTGADIGGKIGKQIGIPGAETAGKAIGAVIGGVVSVVSSVVSGIFGGWW